MNSKAAAGVSVSPSCVDSPVFGVGADVPAQLLAGCEPNVEDPGAPNPPKLIVEPNEEAGVTRPVAALSPDVGFASESVDEPNVPPLPNTLFPAPNADFSPVPNAEELPNGDAEFDVPKADFPLPKAEVPPAPNAVAPVLVLVPKADEPKAEPVLGAEGAATSSFLA